MQFAPVRRPARAMRVVERPEPRAGDTPWGQRHAQTLHIDSANLTIPLPFGAVRRVRRVYLYLDTDAQVLINGQAFHLSVGERGRWELWLEADVVTLAIRAADAPAQGKYVIDGD